MLVVHGDNKLHRLGLSMLLPSFLLLRNCASHIARTPGTEGNSDGVVFSPSTPPSLHLSDKTESFMKVTRTTSFLSATATDGLNSREFYASADGKGSWDRSPDPIFWSKDDKTIYAEAEDSPEFGCSAYYQKPLLPRVPRFWRSKKQLSLMFSGQEIANS